MGGGAWLFMGLSLVALIAVIIWLLTRSRRDKGVGTASPTPQLPAPETPLEILDKRLARGEVDLETYQAQRAALLARG